jgi:hypothetical protein
MAVFDELSCVLSRTSQMYFNPAGGLMDSPARPIMNVAAGGPSPGGAAAGRTAVPGTRPGAGRYGGRASASASPAKPGHQGAAGGAWHGVAVEASAVSMPPLPRGQGAASGSGSRLAGAGASNSNNISSGAVHPRSSLAAPGAAGVLVLPAAHLAARLTGMTSVATSAYGGEGADIMTQPSESQAPYYAAPDIRDNAAARFEEVRERSPVPNMVQSMLSFLD